MLQKTFDLAIQGKWRADERPFDASRVSRILVVRNDNVGDVLCSTPAIRSLRLTYPQAYIAALVVRYSQDAITGNPDLDEVFIYEKAKHRPDRSRWVSLYKQFKVLQEIRKKRFDLAAGLRSSFSWSEAWLVYFSGAPWRLGYAPVKNIDRWYEFFYNLAADPLNLKGHEVRRVLHLVREVGVKPWDERLIVNLPEKERREVEIFLGENRIPPDRLIGFHLSCRRVPNRWPVEKWSALANLLRRDHFCVALTWGPPDRAIAEAVWSRSDPGVFLYPTSTFKQLGALQERCLVFVCPEGGAMHFSAAVGTPTVALFAEEEPGEWGPWGTGHAVLRQGREAALIPVDEVYRAVHQIIRDMKGEQT